MIYGPVLSNKPLNGSLSTISRAVFFRAASYTIRPRSNSPQWGAAHFFGCKGKPRR